MATHRLSKKRRRVIAGLLSLGMAGGGAAYLLSPAATAGETPNAYTYYAFPSGTPASLHDVTWATTPQLDPGPTSNIYWSHQFSLDNGKTAYIGLQSNGGEKRHFLFSVWDADQSRPGPTGSCVRFTGEGVGQHCETRLDWQQGHTYEFKVTATGDPGWFNGSFTDTTAHTTVDVGTIHSLSAKGISPGGMMDWTEYFEWNFAESNCYNQPGSAAAFAPPQANGGTITAKGAGNRASGGDCNAKVETTPQGVVQHGAVGNTARGRVQNGTKCLQAPGDPAAKLAGCADNPDQAWVHAADGTLRLKWDTCLTAQGSTVASQACQGAPRVGRVSDPAKQWTYDPSTRTLKNRQSGQCLTVAPDGRPATETCAGTPGQQWTLPPAEGSTQPTPNPTPTPTPTPDPTKPTDHTTALTDLTWLTASGGWGPVEKNTGNGERAAGDGHPLTIRGTVYAKGIGTHAASAIEYNLGNSCKSLSVDVGVDDEVHGKGSVDFQIYKDKTKVADSGPLTGTSPVKHLTADLTGATSLRLIVTDNGDDKGWDHADWANPQITCTS
ncbi:NPCBM/NEW2 domain-containing protein [Streptomyces sp. CB01881]|uniref:NPCBM/NEW2 domain-containing protein n=1 Tax=Streptomyces sp. CB01881 TaxID=2078691 RepID=UPI0013867993|nr:NPCBM/NEW2 domain-containing protein [Streptomyces sp. CB01881]